MTRRFSLVVSDTSPLITLAAADALNTLVLSGLRIVIPDLVYFEATDDVTKLGAQLIRDWVVAMNGRGVELAATETFAEFKVIRNAVPQARLRSRGEIAAAEVLGASVASDPEMHALLLFEDMDVLRRNFVTGLPERVAPITTGDFLRVLERAGRLQSAEIVLERAAQQGRERWLQWRALSADDVMNDLTQQLTQSAGD